MLGICLLAGGQPLGGRLLSQGEGTREGEEGPGRLECA